MNFRNLCAALACAATAAILSASPADAQNGDWDQKFWKMETANGCFFWHMAWSDFYDTMLPGTFSEPCTPGTFLNGKGTLSFKPKAPSAESTPFSVTTTFVGGYMNGETDWSSSDGPESKTMNMGCVDYEVENGCIPGVVAAETTVAAAEPAPTAEPQTEPAAEPTPTPEEEAADEDEGAPEEATDGGDEDPGVNEISEGDTPTNRWVEARRTKDTAPKHIPGHDVSQCVGTFWKMHAGTGHYVVYNKCDKPIRVGWCSIGFGGDCIAGKGQIATMDPMMGYASGLKREDTAKYFACSKNIFPVYEGNELVAFSCD